MLPLRLGGEKNYLICGYVLTLASLISYAVGAALWIPVGTKTSKPFILLYLRNLHMGVV